MDDANSTAVSADSASLGDSVIAELLPIAFLIVLVNGVVFYLFAKEKHLRKQSTNYLLFSLAVCDFMTGVINIPLAIIVIMGVFASSEGVILGAFMVALHNMVVVLVVYHIFAITMERYYAIVRPFRHRQIAKKSTVKIIVVIWMVAILLSFLPFLWWQKFLSSPDHIVDKATRKIQMGHIIFCIVFVFLLPYIFIVYSQVVMFRKIKQGTYTSNLQTAVKGDKKNSAIHGGSIHNVKRSLIIFALMAFVHVICWFPWYILTIFNNLWFTISEDVKTVLTQCSHAFLIVRYLTSIANPILYTYFKRDFQEAFKSIILRRKIQPVHCSNSRAILMANRNVGFGARGLTTYAQKDVQCLIKAH